MRRRRLALRERVDEHDGRLVRCVRKHRGIERGIPGDAVHQDLAIADLEPRVRAVLVRLAQLQEGISHVIDATHPFAAQMSRNAVEACARTATPLIGLERPPWQAGPGDDWRPVADPAAAVAALPEAPARVFLAIGKQGLAAFAARPQHHYLLRLVDPPAEPLPLPQASVVLARGPFDAAADTALLRAHAITHVVAKNAGGTGAAAKLTAARTLGLPVILIDRPVLPPRAVAATVAEVMAWLGHAGTPRGV